MQNLTSPTLFIIFNRPDTTRRVFESIRIAKPARLYIAADGPRSNKLGEKERCDEVRKLTEQIDWPCEVKRLYRETNLGCKQAVSDAITWFFQHEEQGIILEDDCLPDQSFFRFTGQMLEQYKNDTSIFHINGSNFLSETDSSLIGDSYYFSKNVHVWGWASWRRAWNLYNIDMKGIDDPLIQKNIKSQFKDKKIGRFWVALFKHIRDKNVDTWDAQWAYTVLISEGICITPKENLIENIGFTSEGTHTFSHSTSNPFTKKLSSMDTSLLNTTRVTGTETGTLIREDLDSIVSYKLYITPLWKRVWNKIKSVI